MPQHHVPGDQAGDGAGNTRTWRAIYVGAILLVSVPYIISFTSQLCSDDFILLYYYGRVPLWKFRTFFDPHTIWTYHPLQDYYYAIGWHLSGIEPWAYRAMSLAFHLAIAVLLMKFGRDLTGSIHFGGWSGLLFAGQWRQWEAVAWAGSIATVQSAFFAMLACVAFLSFLRRRSPVAYAAMLLAAVGWSFSKETIIQLPLFLAAIYSYHRWFILEHASLTPLPSGRCSLSLKRIPANQEEKQSGLRRDQSSRGGLPHPKALPDMVRLLAAPVALVLVYLALYGLLVQNTYTFAKPGYEPAPASAWLSNGLRWLDIALNPLLSNDALKPPLLRKLVHWTTIRHVVPLSVALAALFLAVVSRRMLPLFALALTFAAMIPYFALREAYSDSRYHYGVMIAEAMLVAALGREVWRLAAGKQRVWQSGLYLSVILGGALWVIPCFLQLALCTLHDREANRPARELYDFFASQTDKAGRPVLFVVDSRSVRQRVDVELGWGLLECARLAAGSDAVAAVELGYDLDRHMLDEFNGYAEKYLVRRAESVWSAERLPDSARLALRRASDGLERVTLEKQP